MGMVRSSAFVISWLGVGAAGRLEEPGDKGWSEIGYGVV